MKVHYFQRYHQKENVDTANTMLLLSRFYSYSPNKFYALLKDLLKDDSFNPELYMNIQEKAEKTVPDAVIAQNGFKIVVEAKTSDWFHTDQLVNHLESLKDDCGNKFLLTLCTEGIRDSVMNEFKAKLEEFNENNKTFVRHSHITFEKLCEAVQNQIDDKDYEMQDVLDDYWEFCADAGLIPDFWKYLRVQLARDSLDFNVKNKVYYNAEKSSIPYPYLGLYGEKSVRAIGKIKAVVKAVMENGKLCITPESGDAEQKLDEYKGKIEEIMDAAERELGHKLRDEAHRYYFVEEFYETDFRKTSHKAPRGARKFDLSKLLGVDKSESMPSVKDIAEKLKSLTWE